MRAEYKTVMDEVLGVIRQQRLICFTLDGATDVQGKQVINMMACGPIAFFLEHFIMELRRESASNLLEKLLSAKLRLLNYIRDLTPGFILASGEGDVEIVEEGQTRWGTVFYTAQRANKVKAAIAALPSEILYSELDIDLPEELKMLVTDASYWKGVTALESLLKMICSCLTYLEADEATFSSVYACFVAIKLHIVTLPTSVRSALQLDDTVIEKMISLLHHRLATIYSEAHCLAFATDPLFGSMRVAITAKYDGAFLELGKGSINQQSKAALSRIAAGNDELRCQLYTEYGRYVMRPLNADHDFEEVLFKPSELWSLCDDSSYGSLKGPLSAVHCNPARAAGGERNHKAAKHVHCRTRSRMGTNKVETGTAILFNAKQLDRRLLSTWDTPFCHWLHRLAEPGEDDDAAEGETGSGEDDEIGNDDDIMWEFDRIDLQLGVGSIDDALLFEEEVVLEEGNVIFD
ncbi:unnamed protein product [Sphagnum jensenii]|uniref:Uncharacterized protein n=1 Tax=Sphagnum jensenii TaxID=128206 RepID=A0ABP1C351_9BRYO